MNRLAPLVFLATLVLAIAVLPTAAPPSILRAGLAAYNLWFRGENKTGIICSGLSVETPKGPRFLTAGHCVDAVKEAIGLENASWFISSDPKGERLSAVYPEDYRHQWPEEDWALFRFSSTPDTLIPYCHSLPTYGDTVYSWTGPLGALPILRIGYYSGRLHFPDDPEAERLVGGMHFVQTNGAPGSSGSGLLQVEDEKACVWGIWVGGFTVQTKLDGALAVDLPR